MADYILVDGELYHHGVKGMKWGVRKSRYESRSTRRFKRKAKLATTKEKRDKYTKYYKRSKQFDANMRKIIDDMDVGEAAVTVMLAGPVGLHTVSLLRAAGRGKQEAQLLSGLASKANYIGGIPLQYLVAYGNKSAYIRVGDAWTDKSKRPFLLR